MVLVKEYICDRMTPSDEEIKAAINIANSENCIVKVKWYVPHNGWHERLVRDYTSFEDFKESLPNRYGV